MDSIINQNFNMKQFRAALFEIDKIGFLKVVN